VKHLLFVCVENSCRSQIAEGWARTLGEKHGLRAWSAGSNPSGRVNPDAVATMQEAGIDIAAQTSKGMDDIPENIEFEAVVTMGCGDRCPVVGAKRVKDWPIPDPKNQSALFFGEVRDEIQRRVQRLIDEVCNGA